MATLPYIAVLLRSLLLLFLILNMSFLSLLEYTAVLVLRSLFRFWALHVGGANHHSVLRFRDHGRTCDDHILESVSRVFGVNYLVI